MRSNLSILRDEKGKNINERGRKERDRNTGNKNSRGRWKKRLSVMGIKRES